MLSRRFFMGASIAAMAAASVAVPSDLLAAYGNDWVTPQEYGAAGDGWADDRQAFQLAIESGRPVYVPHTPAGYVLGARLRLGDGAVVEFSKKRPYLKLNSEDWLFEIAGSDVELHGVNANMTHLTYGGAVLLRSDQNHLERINISRMKLFRAHAVLHDLPSPNKVIVLLKLKDVVSYQTKGPGIDLKRSFAYQHLEEVHIGYTGSPNPIHAGFSVAGNEGAFWTKCDVTGGYVGPDNTANHGFVLVNCLANWFDTCMADMVGGGGFVINGGAYHYLEKCVSSMVGTMGFSVVNSGRVTLSSSNVGGRAGMAYAPAHPGFFGYGAPALILDDGCRAYSCAGAPVSLTNCAGARNNVYIG